MKPSIIIATLFSLLFLGCAYQSISVYYNKKETDFNKYKTFAWICYNDSISKLYKGDKVRDNAVHYINHSFILKGYQIDTLAPDLLLDMKLLDENKVAITKCVGYCPTGNYIGYFYPFSDYEFYPPSSPLYPYTPWRYEMDTLVYKDKFKERTITLNVIDRKAGKVVWSATAIGDLYEDKTLEHVVHPEVHKLMKRFPVRSRVRKIKF
jgi:hypothetical protein